MSTFRAAPAFRAEGRLGLLAMLVLLVAVAYPGGFAYQIILALCGITELSPLTSLAYKMVGVWLGTMLGCGFGVSWTVPGPRERSATGWRTVGEFHARCPRGTRMPSWASSSTMDSSRCPAGPLSARGHHAARLEGWGGPVIYGSTHTPSGTSTPFRIEGSPTQEYHRNTFGPDFSYDDFVPRFNEANARWDPDAWAALFERVGARYVVLDQQALREFPALACRAHPNPFKQDYTAKRDIVGELTPRRSAPGRCAWASTTAAASIGHSTRCPLPLPRTSD